jgi:hypothetical protein
MLLEVVLFILDCLLLVHKNITGFGAGDVPQAAGTIRVSSPREVMLPSRNCLVTRLTLELLAPLISMMSPDSSWCGCFEQGMKLQL